MVALLPETAIVAAAILADKFCVLIRTNAFTGADGKFLSVTASVEVAALNIHLDVSAGLLQLADNALYEAKRLGRNRVELAGA